MKIDCDYDIKPLVLAVVAHAAREASAGDEQARQWMANEAIVWLEGIGMDIHPETIQRWTRKGFKLPVRAQRLKYELNRSRA
ncbi:MAG: hypothetical protein Q8L41_14690 [Anaerolineales bacterium]|nr:hypothetical protein [Anaerolineales bacterium]